jgi:hypothetical protein
VQCNLQKIAGSIRRLTARAVADGEERRPVAALCIANPKMLPNSRSKISATEDLEHEDQ